MDRQLLSNLLAENQLDELFRVLKTEANHHLSDLILLEGQWNDLRAKQRNGIISNEQANLEGARIRKSLLELIELSAGGQAATNTFFPAKKSAPRPWLAIVLAVMGLLMVYLIYAYFSTGVSAPAESKTLSSPSPGKTAVAAKAKTLDASKALPITLSPGDNQYERVYTVIKTSVESTGGDKSLVTIRVGLNFKGIINHLFGTSSFRLVSDQLPGPVAPSNYFSTVVDSRSYAEDNVQFELSDDVREFSIILEGKEDKKWKFSR